MLGKLFKYEFRAEGRILVPVYGATVLLSVISSIMSRFMYGDMTSFTAVRILSLCLTVLFGLLGCRNGSDELCGVRYAL